MTPQLIIPDWPAPASVNSFTTTRVGGFSQPPYDSFNLGDHVADDLAQVNINRQHLVNIASLPEMPRWLSQTHGTEVLDSGHWQAGIAADAMISQHPGHVCTVLTADCLPLLLCNKTGTQVAAVHAGWRGLLNGIIEKTINRFTCPPAELLVWLGPAIGPKAFEVGPEVRQAFIDRQSAADVAFIKTDNGRYLADIYQLARLRLKKSGITAVYGGEHCTVTEAERFFSYRREAVTGRMASVIWLSDS